MSVQPTDRQGGSLPVAVVEIDPRARARVAMLLGEVGDGAAYATLAAFEERWGEHGAVALVLGPSFASSEGLAQVDRLTRSARSVAPILVMDSLDAQVMQLALRSGVRDVVLSDDPGQLRDAIDRVSSAHLPAAGALPPPLPTPAPGPMGKIITVFSTKGGAGKSVLACNLALVLARRSLRPVVLVDGDLQFGDVAVMLKMAPQTTIVDVVANEHRLDQQLLQDLLVRHPSGLQVLPAPIDPAFVDQVTPQTLLEVLRLLRTFCSHIVIDTPAQFSETNLTILEESDEILLVAGMDIPNIKNVKLGLQTLRLLDTPMDKVHLVLNRANSKVKLDAAEVERTLQMKAECLVPSDIVVPQSVNKGVPVVIDAPKSGVAKAIEGLADMFSSAATDARRRR